MFKKKNYLKLTAACQTKANNINNTGIIGNISTIGSKGAYASGSFAKQNAINSTEVLHKIFIIYDNQLII